MIVSLIIMPFSFHNELIFLCTTGSLNALSALLLVMSISGCKRQVNHWSNPFSSFSANFLNSLCTLQDAIKNCIFCMQFLYTISACSSYFSAYHLDSLKIWAQHL